MKLMLFENSVLRVLSLFGTWGHIHHFLSTRGPQGSKLGQFIETPCQCVFTVANRFTCPSFHQERTSSLSTSSFHCLLSLAIGLNSFQLLFPASANVLLCQLFRGAFPSVWSPVGSRHRRDILHCCCLTRISESGFIYVVAIFTRIQ
jgi:hypothetical protein